MAHGAPPPGTPPGAAAAPGSYWAVGGSCAGEGWQQPHLFGGRTPQSPHVSPRRDSGGSHPGGSSPHPAAGAAGGALTRSGDSAGAELVNVRDPGVYPHAHYEVPVSRIMPTAGFRDWYAGNAASRSGPCVCRLYVNGSCHQGERCNSFHCDPSFIRRERDLRGLTADKGYLRELVVRDVPQNRVWAIRYGDTARTEGRESFRLQIADLQHDSFVVPQILCPRGQRESLQCERGARCRYVHVDPRKQLRSVLSATPCCLQHGDEEMLQHPELLVARGVQLPPGCAAPTAFLSYENIAYTRGVLHAHTAFCGPHVRSRCKIGRDCQQLHVCREWAAAHGLDQVLEAQQRGSRTPTGGTPPPGSRSPRSLTPPQPAATRGRRWASPGHRDPRQAAAWEQNPQWRPAPLSALLASARLIAGGAGPGHGGHWPPHGRGLTAGPQFYAAAAGEAPSPGGRTSPPPLESPVGSPAQPRRNPAAAHRDDDDILTGCFEAFPATPAPPAGGEAAAGGNA